MRSRRSMNAPRNNARAVLMGLGASAILTALIIIGSRNLEHYDAALFGYTVASVVAFGALVYRYAEWLRRPATRVYWKRGWQLFRQRKKFLTNTATAPHQKDFPYERDEEAQVTRRE